MLQFPLQRHVQGARQRWKPYRRQRAYKSYTRWHIVVSDPGGKRLHCCRTDCCAAINRKTVAENATAGTAGMLLITVTKQLIEEKGEANKVKQTTSKETKCRSKQQLWNVFLKTNLDGRYMSRQTRNAWDAIVEQTWRWLMNMAQAVTDDMVSDLEDGVKRLKGLKLCVVHCQEGRTCQKPQRAKATLAHWGRLQQQRCVKRQYSEEQRKSRRKWRTWRGGRKHV